MLALKQKLISDALNTTLKRPVWLQLRERCKIPHNNEKV
jgi:hypothetical protein